MRLINLDKGNLFIPTNNPDYVYQVIGEEINTEIEVERVAFRSENGWVAANNATRRNLQGVLDDKATSDHHKVAAFQVLLKRGRMFTSSSTQVQRVIIAVQKNYKGDLAYRVVADSECFGYIVEPGSPSDIL